LPNKRQELLFPASSIKVKQDFEKGEYGGSYQVELLDDIIESNGVNQNAVRVKAHSAWSQTKINEYYSGGQTFEIKKSPATFYTTLQSEGNFIAPSDLITKEECGVETNTEASEAMKSLGLPFDFPKPVSLIKYLINMVAHDDNDAIIFDFFAGSGTTAQAVMELNAEDGGNRKWILVQLPEQTDEKSEARRRGYATIADIAVERIRRAGAVIASKAKQSRPNRHDDNLDLGFRLYKVANSNFKKWNDHPADADELRQQVLDHLDPLVDGAHDDDLLTELLLKTGISPLDAVENHDGWHFVPSANLAICLSRQITTELFSEILSTNPAKVILLDIGFGGDSQLKANILLQAGEKNVEVEVG
jgi:adenine-specific DNA-methyltransferase